MDGWYEVGTKVAAGKHNQVVVLVCRGAIDEKNSTKYQQRICRCGEKLYRRTAFKKKMQQAPVSRQ